MRYKILHSYTTFAFFPRRIKIFLGFPISTLLSVSLVTFYVYNLLELYFFQGSVMRNLAQEFQKLVRVMYTAMLPWENAPRLLLDGI